MPAVGHMGRFGGETFFFVKEARMDRLSIVLTFMTGSVLVGGFVIVVLSLGYYDWRPIAAAVAFGLVVTWPAAYVISRWIKLEDPNWRLRSGARKDSEKRQSDFPET